MDIPGLLQAEADALRETRRTLGTELERTKAAIAAHDAVLGALDGLRRCDICGFMSNERGRWFFVSAFEASPRDRREPGVLRISCVIVPEAVIDQHRHRPVPHADPAQAARGVVTMTPTLVAGAEIARETAASYASGVVLGGYADARTERCAVCGETAVVVANHGWDWDSGYQWLVVHRLCPRCPRLETLASDGWDDKTPCPLLPPSPARR